VNEARAIAEGTARAAYGRLLAFLAASTGNIAAAEDALAEAFAEALQHWPERGAPDAPEAWLIAVAQRKIIDAGRRAQTSAAAEPDLIRAFEEAGEMTSAGVFVDDRLKLLFVCAHPAIDPAARTPLMLQTVMGLDAARIASAFLVAPSAMSQRLVRAKRKIAEARLRFEIPSAEDIAGRSEAVLDAIYAAFTAGYDATDDAGREDLAREALFLARLAARLLAGDAEAQGLLALICLIEARRSARRTGGAYVPLDEQEAALWDAALILEGEAALSAAARLKAPGRFQLEAAIQSAHVAGRRDGVDIRDSVVRLYDRLIAVAPSTGAEIGRAAALFKADRAEDALAALDLIEPAQVGTHQPYWAARAHVLAALGRLDDARRAFDYATGLVSDGTVRQFLREAKARLTR
jgi:RNA polymerase sigma-70 factor (ECF subfamily)